MSDFADNGVADLVLTPEQYLAEGFCDGDGRARAILLGAAARSAATQLMAAELAPQELAFTYEAFRILLPRLAGAPQARAVLALAQALGMVARMIRQPNNEGLEVWCRACVAAIRSEADTAAFLAHIQATLRLQALMADLPSPEELAASSSSDSL